MGGMGRDHHNSPWDACWSFHPRNWETIEIEFTDSFGCGCYFKPNYLMYLANMFKGWILEQTDL